jgi:5-methylcytosine-specific restriction endonuclease McrA
MSDKKKIRDAFRNAVWKRDGYKCVMCGKKAVDAHHITDRNDMPWGGYVLENGISLCAECHLLAEQWHVSGNKEAPEGWHPDDLYKKIGSSKELAVEKSDNLNLEFKLRKR